VRRAVRSAPTCAVCYTAGERPYRRTGNSASGIPFSLSPPRAGCGRDVAAGRAPGVDAAILFADILLPFEPLRLGLSFAAGEGPRIARPIRDAADVDKLSAFNLEAELGYVCDAARLARRALPAEVPLIGFAGAPFTLASYAIEGGASRTFTKTKMFMYQAPDTWHLLMSKFTDLEAPTLHASVPAHRLQLFDSWVGCLTPQDYCTYVQRTARALQLAAAQGVPLFTSAGTATFLEDFAAAGGDVIVDWRIRWMPPGRALGTSARSGEFDPRALLAPPAQRDRLVREILKQAEGRPGHIFNLGHGILPETDVAAARAVVDLVHDA
jgi:uroporphyrinogen decarboxylase